MKEKIPLLFPLTVIGALIIAFLSNDLYLPSMPVLSKFYKTNDNLIQATITTWFAGSMSFQWLLGPLSDRYGRRKLICIATLSLSLISLLCALSSSIYFFLILRYFQGVAVSGIMVAAFSALHEAYDNEKGIQIMGYATMSTGLAPILGPILGGLLAYYFIWQINFYVLTVASFLFWLLLLSNMIETKSIKDNYPFEIKFILNQNIQMFSNKKYILSTCTYSLLFLAGGALLAGVSFIYIDILGINSQFVGFAIAPALIFYMVFAGLTNRFSKKFNAEYYILTNIFFAFISMLIFALISIFDKKNFSIVIISICLYYASLGMIGPVITHMALTYSEENAGIGSAMLTFLMMAGCTIGSAAASMFYNHTIFSIAIIMAIATFLSLITYLKYTRIDKINIMKTSYN